MENNNDAITLCQLLVTTKDGDWGKDSPVKGYLPYRVIRGTDFLNIRIGNILNIPLRYLKESTVDRRTLKPDDILIETAGGSRNCPTGRSLLITKQILTDLGMPTTCASFARFLRVDSKKADAHYIYWYLQYLYATGQMEKHQIQHTGVARFQYTRFAETQEIFLPSRDKQRAIAQILCALDDKIRANNRINETLEAMARAIFKSWFVDFDPVRAKAAGKKTIGLAPHIADLFPDSFEDSELGQIPKGWKVGRLADLVTNIVDRVNPSAATQAIPYVPIECISPRTICLPNFQPGSQACSSLIRFRRGDILFGAMRPYFHKVCIAPFDGTTRTTAFVLRADPSELGYAVLVVSRNETIDFATAHSEGSTIPYAKWTNSLETLPIVLPSNALRLIFHQSVEPMITRMMGAMNESQTLVTLRDALLPKLISGDIRMNDIGKL